MYNYISPRSLQVSTSPRGSGRHNDERGNSRVRKIWTVLKKTVSWWTRGILAASYQIIPLKGTPVSTATRTATP